MRLEDGDCWSQNDGYFSMVNLYVHNSSRPPTWVVRLNQQFHFGVNLIWAMLPHVEEQSVMIR